LTAKINDILSPEIEHENQGATITIFTPVKFAMVMAQIPWIFLLRPLLSATLLSIIVLIVRNLSIVVENDRWKSRQKLIANCDM